VLSREEESCNCSSAGVLLLSGLRREVWEAVGVSAEGGITGMHGSPLRGHS